MWELDRVSKLSWIACAATLVLGDFTRAAHAADEARHEYVSFTSDGKVGGRLTLAKGVDGVVRSTYIHKENGRGPELTEEYRLSDDGTLVSYEVQGKETFGAPVDESFGSDGTVVRWRSEADRGEAPVIAGALYWPVSGSPAMLGVAVDALSQRADRRLPLIPMGGLTSRPVAEAQLTTGQARQKLRLVQLDGLDLTPTFVWVTDEPRPRFFAYLLPTQRLIDAQWQTQVALLYSRQEMAERGALLERQERLTHRLPGTTLIRNARVFDSEHAKVDGPRDVLIREGRIAAIVAAGSGPQADHVVEAGGRVLTPGLFDMHVHIWPWEGVHHVAAGVTTVRDLGNDNELLQRLIADERAGTLLLPHIVPAGLIEGESPNSVHIGFVVKNLDEAKRAIDWYAAAGYPQIKIYNSFPKSLVRATAAYAHGKGMRVSGHVPAFMRARDVVDQGYDEIQHINQVLLNFLVTDTTDTRTLERFRLPADKVADLDFDSPAVRDFMQTLVQHGTVLDPTVAAFEFFHQRSGEVAPGLAAVVDHLPISLQRASRTAQMDIPDDATHARYTRSYDKMVEFVGRAYRAGVPIVAGTDDYGGFVLHHELVLYVRAGLTPAQALQVATWNGAKYARVLDDRGSITVGKRADLVLFDGDPTVNIADVRKAVLVLKDGNAYYPSELYEAFGVRPFAEPLRVK